MSSSQAMSPGATSPASHDDAGSAQGWPRYAAWVVWVALVLAIAGVGLAGYLAFENVQDRSGICTGVAKSCHTVQQSEYGKIAGVPVSVPGVALYAALAVLAVLWLMDFRAQRVLWTQLAVLGGVAGFAFSMYLTSIEAFVLDAWCVYCVVSALLVTSLLALWLVVAIAAGRGSAAPDSD